MTDLVQGEPGAPGATVVTIAVVYSVACITALKTKMPVARRARAQAAAAEHKDPAAGRELPGLVERYLS